ncbi:MAG: FAD-binding oxidoreductase [Devosiaceae bacterium]|nr:FAD-binding oxidoreductase [Devosiaceae bacterium]
MSKKKQAAFRAAKTLQASIPPQQIKTDPVYTYAYSGDASYFRLVPALVVIVNNEQEVCAVMKAAQNEGLSITFRAAGTSLCGQAVTNGILCVLGDGWRDIKVLEKGKQITLGPAVIVSQANTQLKAFDRKIGPDPASLNTCKIGGVVSNNSSGMCCGVAQNTYHTMDQLRIVLTDGTVLDSGDPTSVEAFKRTRPDIIKGLKELAEQTKRDNTLVDIIRRKYEIKNTVGYSLNALIDFDDPIDILTHLMVGSEGTLSFISEITYNTVHDHPHKATALVPFVTNHLAAEGVQALHAVGVSAAEFMERKALATVEHLPALQPFVSLLNDTSPAVLIEIMAPSEKLLDIEIEKAIRAMQKVGTLTPPQFIKDPEIQLGLWDIRKGLFASAGGDRPKGTVMLTEDVAVPIHRLADAVDDLRIVLDRHEYHEGIIFGHALAGNLHFQMHADFTSQSERDRFDAFTADLAHLVSVTYKGSLKAEHGTGRAIAPFVEQEWGEKAYKIMHRIKNIFDEEKLLNPGVLLNDNQKIHIANTKHMMPSNEIADLCIECGFCEPACPSAGLTLSPRQRIALTREQARLQSDGSDNDLLSALNQGFIYAGMDTCAGCNLCSLRCPIGIETGTMILGSRADQRTKLGDTLANFAAGNLNLVESAMKGAITTQNLARKIVGDNIVDGISGSLNSLSGGKIPKPGRTLTKGPGTPKQPASSTNAPHGNITYFPACASRMFGTPKTAYDLLPVTQAMLILLQRAGYNPVLPKNLTGLCCGQPFASKGFPQKAKQVGKELQNQLDQVTKGNVKIVTDMSTCALHMQKDGTGALDSAQFLLTQVLPHLTITNKVKSIAVHHNCSAQRLSEQAQTEALANACANKISVLTSITCCGYAGDKGMYQPQLNAHALRLVKNDIPSGCDLGVSTVATCAIGLSEHAKIPFVALASLLEFVSRP